MDHVTSGIVDDVTTCDTLLSVVVSTIDQLNAVRPQPDIRSVNMSAAESCHVLVDRVVNKAVAPVICVFGIIGNLLNLVVLTRKRLQTSMDFIEKSSNISFVALAVSDMIFCLVYFSTCVVRLTSPSSTHSLTYLLTYYLYLSVNVPCSTSLLWLFLSKR